MAAAMSHSVALPIARIFGNPCRDLSNRLPSVLMPAFSKAFTPREVRCRFRIEAELALLDKGEPVATSPY